MEPENGRDEVLAQTAKEAAVAPRRSFLIVLAGIGAAAVGVLMALPLVRFALYPLFARTTDTSWSDLGPLDSFSGLAEPVQKIMGVSQRDGWRETISQKPVYVTKGPDGQVTVLSTVCPHLGCQVPWDPQKHEFFCPCHGSSFAPDGARLGGPTPRGLDSLPTMVQNGHLMARYQVFRQLVPEKEVVG
jgi:menaquinol-cytochrome c reductase iron-sulfur subunit